MWATRLFSYLVPIEEEGATPSTRALDIWLSSGPVFCNIPINYSLVINNDLSHFQRDWTIMNAVKKVMSLKQNQPMHPGPWASGSTSPSWWRNLSSATLNMMASKEWEIFREFSTRQNFLGWKRNLPLNCLPKDIRVMVWRFHPRSCSFNKTVQKRVNQWGVNTVSLSENSSSNSVQTWMRQPSKSRSNHITSYLPFHLSISCVVTMMEWVSTKWMPNNLVA